MSRTKRVGMKEETKTAYEWCVELNVRVLDVNEFPVTDFVDDGKWTPEQFFFEAPFLTKLEILNALTKCKVKPNSIQRKTDDFLEYRMYGLVSNSLSDIQKGIQFGHAVVEYGIYTYVPEIQKMYDRWSQKDKTFIILNGGTTNTNTYNLGSLNKHLKTLHENNIKTAEFYEPDLGDQLTAVVFLADERIWKKDLYPDFVPETLPWSKRKYRQDEMEMLERRNEVNYEEWLTKIGGPKNAFLRKFLKDFKLA